MCVILWVNKTRPTDYMVERAYDHNKDGAGIAWREKNADGETEVVWRKGLNKDELVELCASAPLPYIAHARIATIGGIRPELTHPFPIELRSSLALSGRTQGRVLFHNGHVKEWDDLCKRAVGTRDNDDKLVQIPMGRWSDTRALAWLCALYGPGYMEFFPEQKGVVFGPKDIQIYDGNGWDKINDVWCSNGHFMKHTPSSTSYTPARGSGVGLNGRFCRMTNPSCINQVLDTDGWCFMHPRGTNRGKPVNGNTVEGTVMGPATGGSRVPPSPFVQRLPLDLLPGEVISLEIAQKLWKENQLSKNKLKKIQSLWEKATQPGKKAVRAEQALRQISISIMKQQSTGFDH